MSLRKINELFSFEKGILQSSKCIEGEFNFITAAADWKKHNEYSHDCEALIFAAAASGSLGRTHHVNGKFISSDLCFILIPKDPALLPIDLKFYHIIFNLYKKEIVAATKAGTSKEAIGLKIFGEYELPYFDISLQQKVKSEFGRAEKLRNSLNEEYSYQLTQIENLNQAILQEAVQGKLVPQDAKDEPASELLKRIKAEKTKSGKKEKPLPPIKPDEIPFEIPESWVWCRLGQLALYSEAGKSYKCNEVPIIDDEWGVLKVSAVSWDIFLEEQNKLYSKTTPADLKAKIEIGDFIISRANTSQLVGKSVVVKSLSKNLLLSDKTIRIKFSALVSIDFINKCNNSLYARDYYSRMGTGSSPSMKNITREHMNNLLIPVPPLSEQKCIVAETEKQLAKTKQLKEHIIANQQATEQLLKALLHEAFEGEGIK